VTAQRIHDALAKLQELSVLHFAMEVWRTTKNVLLCESESEDDGDTNETQVSSN
jgi:hypothetical protein